MNSVVVRQACRLLLVSVLAFLTACGTSNRSRLSGARAELRVPAGVDSTIALQADSLSRALALDARREREADRLRQRAQELVAASDSLWALIEATREVSATDSLAAIDQFNRAARHLREIAELQRRQGNGASAKLQKQVLDQLERARGYLEKAVQLNPFDREARSWLARVYQALASRFSSRDDQWKAVEVLENMVRLEKGQHSLFGRLGEAYFSLGLWEEAYRNFSEAERVLRETAFENIQSGPVTLDSLRQAPVDTAALFYYAYYEGATLAKLHRPEESLERFQLALEIAPNDEDRQAVVAYIRWINWDGGNIAASETRDALFELQAQGRYQEAVRGFIDLAPRLRTPQARDEIEWRAAVLEYQMLNRKSSALQRMYGVIQRRGLTNSTAALDSIDQRYLESYGTMCHNMGLESLEKNRQTAFAYFLQAVHVPWSGRAKSYLELAKLSQNNPEAAVRYGKAALESRSALNREELKQAYRLLTAAYKRLGRFEEARQSYAKWLELK